MEFDEFGNPLPEEDLNSVPEPQTTGGLPAYFDETPVNSFPVETYSEGLSDPYLNEAPVDAYPGLPEDTGLGLPTGLDYQEELDRQQQEYQAALEQQQLDQEQTALEEQIAQEEAIRLPQLMAGETETDEPAAETPGEQFGLESLRDLPFTPDKPRKVEPLLTQEEVAAQAKEQGPVTFSEEVKNIALHPLTKLPIIKDIVRIRDYERYKSAYDRLQANQYANEVDRNKDLDYLNRTVNTQRIEDSRGKKLGARLAEGIMDLGAYAAMFAFTGNRYNRVKGRTVRALNLAGEKFEAEVAKEAAIQGIDLAKTASPDMLKAAETLRNKVAVDLVEKTTASKMLADGLATAQVMLPVFAADITASTMEKMIPLYNINDAGDIEFIPQQKSWVAEAAKQTLKEEFELVFERGLGKTLLTDPLAKVWKNVGGTTLGNAVAKYLAPGLVAASAPGKVTVAEALRKSVSPKVAKFFGETLSQTADILQKWRLKAGFGSIPEELAEELLTDVADSVFNLNTDDPRTKDMSYSERLLFYALGPITQPGRYAEMAAIFAIPMIGASGWAAMKDSERQQVIEENYKRGEAFHNSNRKIFDLRSDFDAIATDIANQISLEQVDSRFKDVLWLKKLGLYQRPRPGTQTRLLQEMFGFENFKDVYNKAEKETPGSGINAVKARLYDYQAALLLDNPAQLEQLKQKVDSGLWGVQNLSQGLLINEETGLPYPQRRIKVPLAEYQVESKLIPQGKLSKFFDVQVPISLPSEIEKKMPVADVVTVTDFLKKMADPKIKTEFTAALPRSDAFNAATTEALIAVAKAREVLGQADTKFAFSPNAQVVAMKAGQLFRGYRYMQEGDTAHVRALSMPDGKTTAFSIMATPADVVEDGIESIMHAKPGAMERINQFGKELRARVKSLQKNPKTSDLSKAILYKVREYLARRGGSWEVFSKMATRALGTRMGENEQNYMRQNIESTFEILSKYDPDFVSRVHTEFLKPLLGKAYDALNKPMKPSTSGTGPTPAEIKAGLAEGAKTKGEEHAVPKRGTEKEVPPAARTGEDEIVSGEGVGPGERGTEIAGKGEAETGKPPAEKPVEKPVEVEEQRKFAERRHKITGADQVISYLETTFDQSKVTRSEEHIYKVNGKEMPSVTAQVNSDEAFKFDRKAVAEALAAKTGEPASKFLAEWEDERAGGEKFHAEIEKAIKTGNTASAEVKKLVTQITKLVKAAGGGKALSEFKIWTAEGTLGGTLDLLVPTRNGSVLLFDVKTYATNPHTDPAFSETRENPLTGKEIPSSFERARQQLLGYAAILESQGVRVAGMYIIPGVRDGKTTRLAADPRGKITISIRSGAERSEVLARFNRIYSKTGLEGIYQEVMGAAKKPAGKPISPPVSTAKSRPMPKAGNVITETPMDKSVDEEPVKPEPEETQAQLEARLNKEHEEWLNRLTPKKPTASLVEQDDSKTLETREDNITASNIVTDPSEWLPRPKVDNPEDDGNPFSGIAADERTRLRHHHLLDKLGLGFSVSNVRLMERMAKGSPHLRKALVSDEAFKEWLNMPTSKLSMHEGRMRLFARNHKIPREVMIDVQRVWGTSRNPYAFENLVSRVKGKLEVTDGRFITVSDESLVREYRLPLEKKLQDLFDLKKENHPETQVLKEELKDYFTPGIEPKPFAPILARMTNLDPVWLADMEQFDPKNATLFDFRLGRKYPNEKKMPPVQSKAQEWFIRTTRGIEYKTRVFRSGAQMSPKDITRLRNSLIDQFVRTSEEGASSDLEQFIEFNADRQENAPIMFKKPDGTPYYNQQASNLLFEAFENLDGGKGRRYAQCMGIRNPSNARESTDNSAMSNSDLAKTERYWFESGEGYFMMWFGPLEKKPGLWFVQTEKVKKGSNRAKQLIREYTKLYEETYKKQFELRYNRKDAARATQRFMLDPSLLPLLNDFEFNIQLQRPLLQKDTLGHFAQFKNKEELEKRASQMLTSGITALPEIAQNPKLDGKVNALVMEDPRQFPLDKWLDWKEWYGKITDRKVSAKEKEELKKKEPKGIEVTNGVAFMLTPTAERFREGLGYITTNSGQFPELLTAKMLVNTIENSSRTMFKFNFVTRDKAYETMPASLYKEIFGMIDGYNRSLKGNQPAIDIVFMTSGGKIMPGITPLNPFEHNKIDNTIKFKPLNISEENLVQVPVDKISWVLDARHTMHPDSTARPGQLTPDQAEFLELFARETALQLWKSRRNVAELQKKGGFKPEEVLDEVYSPVLALLRDGHTKPDFRAEQTYTSLLNNRIFRDVLQERFMASRPIEMPWVSRGSADLPTFWPLKLDSERMTYRPFSIDEVAAFRSGKLSPDKVKMSRINMDLVYRDKSGTMHYDYSHRFLQDEIEGKLGSVGGHSTIAALVKKIRSQTEVSILNKKPLRYLDLFIPDTQMIDTKTKKLRFENVANWNIAWWEADQHKGLWYAPGELAEYTRIPGEGPHSHTMGRLTWRTPLGSSLIQAPLDDGYFAGADYDVDVRTLQTIALVTRKELTDFKGLYNLIMLHKANLLYGNPAHFWRLKSLTDPATAYESSVRRGAELANAKLNKAIAEKDVKTLLKYSMTSSFGSRATRENLMFSQRGVGVTAATTHTLSMMMHYGIGFKQGSVDQETYQFKGSDGKDHEVLFNLINDNRHEGVMKTRAKSYVVIKDALSRILQLYLDHGKLMRIDKIGVTAETLSLPLTLIYANGNLTTDDQVDKYMQTITELLHTNTTRAYVAQKRIYSTLEGKMMPRTTNWKAVEANGIALGDTPAQARTVTGILTEAEAIGWELYSMSQFIRQMAPGTRPKTAAEYQQFRDVTTRIFSGKLEHLDASPILESSDSLVNHLKENLDAVGKYAYGDGLNDVFHTASLFTATGKKLRNMIVKKLQEVAKQEGTKKRYGDWFWTQVQNRMAFAGSKLALYRFLPKQYRGPKGEKILSQTLRAKFNEYREQAEDKLGRPNTFLETLEWNRNSLRLARLYQGIDALSEDARKMQADFDSLPSDLQVMLVYHDLSRNNKFESAQAGGYLDLIGPKFTVAWNKAMVKEKYDWTKDRLSSGDLATLANFVAFEQLGGKTKKYNQETGRSYYTPPPFEPWEMDKREPSWNMPETLPLPKYDKVAETTAVVNRAARNISNGGRLGEDPEHPYTEYAQKLYDLLMEYVPSPPARANILDEIVSLKAEINPAVFANLQKELGVEFPKLHGAASELVAAKTRARQNVRFRKSFEIVDTSAPFDVLGMRANGGKATMANTEPPTPGWLGNPFKWRGNGGPANVTVQQAIAKFKEAFLRKVNSDLKFREAVIGLEGKTVGYFAPKSLNHLQVVQDWLATRPVMPEKQTFTFTAEEVPDTFDVIGRNGDLLTVSRDPAVGWVVSSKGDFNMMSPISEEEARTYFESSSAAPKTGVRETVKEEPVKEEPVKEEPVKEKTVGKKPASPADERYIRESFEELRKKEKKEITPGQVAEPTTFEQAKKVLESKTTILSNAEARALMKTLKLETDNEMPRILTASERSDPVWHAEEVKKLVASGDYDALYLITKHDGLPMRELLQLPIPKLIHFSITTLGGTKWEPGVMKWQDLMTRIEEFIKQGLDPAMITIRVDPLVPGETSITALKALLARVVKAGIKRVRFSVMDGYSGEIAKRTSTLYGPGRMAKYYKKVGDRMEAKQEVVDGLAEHFVALAKDAGITEVGSCAEKINVPGVLKEGCLPVKAVEELVGHQVSKNKSKQRPLCLCFGGKVDALKYDHTCASACAYCYARHGSNKSVQYYNPDGTLKLNRFTQTSPEFKRPVKDVTASLTEDNVVTQEAGRQFKKGKIKKFEMFDFNKRWRPRIDRIFGAPDRKNALVAYRAIHPDVWKQEPVLREKVDRLLEKKFPASLPDRDPVLRDLATEAKVPEEKVMEYLKGTDGDLDATASLVVDYGIAEGRTMKGFAGEQVHRNFLNETLLSFMGQQRANFAAIRIGRSIDTLARNKNVDRAKLSAALFYAMEHKDPEMWKTAHVFNDMETVGKKTLPIWIEPNGTILNGKNTPTIQDLVNQTGQKAFSDILKEAHLTYAKMRARENKAMAGFMDTPWDQWIRRFDEYVMHKYQNRAIQAEVEKLVRTNMLEEHFTTAYSDAERDAYFELPEVQKELAQRIEKEMESRKTSAYFSRETTGRTRRRKYDTYEEALTTKGLVPHTTDLPSAIRMWQTSVSEVARNKRFFTLASTMSDMRGFPMMIPIRSTEDVRKESAISDRQSWDVLRNVLAFVNRTNPSVHLTPDLTIDPWVQINNALVHAQDGNQKGTPALESLGYKFVAVPGFSLQGVWVQEGTPAKVLDFITRRGFEELRHTMPIRFRLLQFFRWFNSTAKFLALSISLFHHAALMEGYLASAGMQPYVDPRRWKRLGSTISEFRRLFHAFWTKDFNGSVEIKRRNEGILETQKQNLEDWITNWIGKGLVIGQISPDLEQTGGFDSALDTLIDLTGRTFLTRHFIGSGLKALKAAKNINDRWLWQSYQPTLKLQTAERLLVEMEADSRFDHVPREQKMADVATYVNDIFGGQLWERYLWANPMARDIMQSLVFAPDWTMSALQASGAFDFLKNNAGINVPFFARQGTATQFAQETKFQQYWPAFILIVLTGIPAAIQAAIYALFGDPEKGDKMFPWQNETGMEFYVDMTPLLRAWGKKYGITRDRRAYWRWGKQGWELVGWAKNPVKEMLAKTSMGFKVGWEQVTGQNTAFWDMPWRNEETTLGGLFSVHGDWTKSRIASVLEKMVPMSYLSVLKDRPTTLFAPAKLGISKFSAVQQMLPLLTTYADSEAHKALLSRPEYLVLMKRLVGELLDAAELNGYNREEVFMAAVNKVRSRVYLEIWGELNKESLLGAGRKADAEKIKDLVARLRRVGGTWADFKDSLRRRAGESQLKLPAGTLSQLGEIWRETAEPATPEVLPPPSGKP